mmetsp:Transcript_887/g.2366  ORF Transcript_887/g.2366 Transcript_887/m.2366 type:complete len:265 (+) Transcript_887:265-1059(+)
MAPVFDIVAHEGSCMVHDQRAARDAQCHVHQDVCASRARVRWRGAAHPDGGAAVGRGATGLALHHAHGGGRQGAAQARGRGHAAAGRACVGAWHGCCWPRSCSRPPSCARRPARWGSLRARPRRGQAGGASGGQGGGECGVRQGGDRGQGRRAAEASRYSRARPAAPTRPPTAQPQSRLRARATMVQVAKRPPAAKPSRRTSVTSLRASATGQGSPACPPRVAAVATRRGCPWWARATCASWPRAPQLRRRARTRVTQGHALLP